MRVQCGKYRNYIFRQCKQCGNCCYLVSQIFGKNFVKVTFLLNKLLLVDFTEKLQIGNLVINVIDLSQHTNQSLNQLHQIDWYIKSSGIGLFQHQFLARNGSKSAVTIFAVFRTQFSRNIFRKIVFCISRNFAKLATLVRLHTIEIDILQIPIT